MRLSSNTQEYSITLAAIGYSLSNRYTRLNSAEFENTSCSLVKYSNQSASGVFSWSVYIWPCIIVPKHSDTYALVSHNNEPWRKKLNRKDKQTGGTTSMSKLTLRRIFRTLNFTVRKKLHKNRKCFFEYPWDIYMYRWVFRFDENGSLCIWNFLTH